MAKPKSKKPGSKKTVASVSQFCAFGASPETVVHPNLKNYFGYCLYKSAARLKALLDRKLSAEGMVTSQLGLMRILETGGAVSQVELCGTMGIDKATMVKLIDGLEQQGLAVRKASGGDRRVKLVEITAAGQRKLKVATRLRDEAEEEFLGHLTAAERQSLKTILPKLLK